MGTFSLDNTMVDTGPYVLSVSPGSVLLLDDDRGQRDNTTTGQLMAAVAGGDRAAVLGAMREAADQFANGVAIVADADRASAFLFGSMVVTCETAGARITVTALDGAVDEIPLPSTLTNVTITPEGSIPLRVGEGTTPTQTAVRAARVRIQLTPTVPVPPAPVVPPPLDTGDVSPSAEAPDTPPPAPPTPEPSPAAPPAPPTPEPSPAAPPAPPSGAPSAPPAPPSPAAPPAPPAAPPSAPPAPPAPAAPSAPPAPPAPSAAPPAPPSPASPPTPPEGTPAVAPPPENVELFDVAGDGAPPRPPLPVDDGSSDDERERVQVLGVQCPRGHHNHPEAVYCAQCGLRMGVNQTLIAGLGPRPALGLLLLDDGTTHPIDSDMIVGREPHFHDAVVSGDAVDVAVNDPELNLSREHFLIRLVDWDVTAMDLNSSNGTLLQRHQTTDWIPLSTSSGTTVSSGDKLRAGSRVFQIQLHHIQT